MDKSVCEYCMEKPYHCSRCSINGITEYFGYGENHKFIESFINEQKFKNWLQKDEKRKKVTWEEIITDYRDKEIRSN